MAENDKPARPKPIVDVAHPGKSAPSGNSKSVIVSNRPLLKDPMVVADDAKTPDDSPSQNAATKITVKGPDKPGTQPLTAPLLETETPDASETAAETANPDKPAPAPKAASEAESKPEPEPEPKPETEPEAKLKPKHEKVLKPSATNTPADEPAAASDAPTPEDKDGKDQPATDKPKPDATENENGDKPETADTDAEGQSPTKVSTEQLEAEAAAQAKHQAAIEKLADSKKYYLPINTVEKRRSRRFVAVGIILSLLLIVAWADIALDAGLIQIHGLKPVTHFFSN